MALQSSTQAAEGGLGIRIGNALARGRVGETGEAGELAPPAFGHGAGQFGAEVAEEQERLGGGEFLAHEQQRRLRREQQHGRDGFHHRRGGEVAQALAEGAVADLVVVLQEIDERQQAAGGRSVRRAICRARRPKLRPDRRNPR